MPPKDYLSSGQNSARQPEASALGKGTEVLQFPPSQQEMGDGGAQESQAGLDLGDATPPVGTNVSTTTLTIEDQEVTKNPPKQPSRIGLDTIDVVIPEPIPENAIPESLTRSDQADPVRPPIQQEMGDGGVNIRNTPVNIPPEANRADNTRMPDISHCPVTCPKDCPSVDLSQLIDVASGLGHALSDCAQYATPCLEGTWTCLAQTGECCKVFCECLSAMEF